MRLKWQCPICYAQLNVLPEARMLTCPYCGALLRVGNRANFYLIKKEVGWYYFPQKDITEFSGYIKYGENEEYYRYSRGKWYLIKDDRAYEMIIDENIKCDSLPFLGEGKMEYMWGQIPVLAPPGSLIRNYGNDKTICKSISDKIYIFRR